MLKGIAIATALTVILAGCGSQTKVASTTDTKQTAASSTAATSSTTSNDKPAPKADTTNKTDDTKKKDDIWTYYNNATWSDDFNGLKSEIEKVVVSDKAPKVEGGKVVAGQYDSYVGVKFKLTNTTKDKFTAYPDQARLVTSTGEQIDNPDILGTEHIGGEIDEGVTKEGNVVWKLKRGQAEQIQWIKLQWDTHLGSEDKLDSNIKKYEIKIDLKK